LNRKNRTVLGDNAKLPQLFRVKEYICSNFFGMQLLMYILFYPLIWCISKLPFRALYILSDGICFLVYRVVRYRKKTVRENIALALPHLSFTERVEVERKFYHHLCDLFLEMMKTLSITDDEINARFVYTNIDTFLDLEKKQKSIAILCAHYNSYEWSISINSKITFEAFAIYKKISNQYFDRLVHKIRSRFKATLITNKEAVSKISQNARKKQLGLYGFASDQSPRVNAAHHWKNFMGHYVPVHTGGEMLAKKYDMNVVFLKIIKVKRGFYEAELVNIYENVKDIPNYEITDRFMEMVEQQILEAPEFYLWTHKRWKHRKV
jgi:KDO2-lipid IV(A) lauroyltransferase